MAVVALRDEVRTAHVGAAGHEQLIGREAGDHIAPGRGHDHLFLDPRRRAPVRRGAVGLEGEDHPFLELDGVLERMDARDHRGLVEPDADAVSELKTEAGFLVRETQLLGGRPDLRDPVRCHSGTYERDRVVEPFATLLVRVQLRVTDATDVERAVVARAVPHERMDDVEERLIART